MGLDYTYEVTIILNHNELGANKVQEYVLHLFSRTEIIDCKGYTVKLLREVLYMEGG